MQLDGRMQVSFCSSTCGIFLCSFKGLAETRKGEHLSASAHARQTCPTRVYFELEIFSSPIMLAVEPSHAGVKGACADCFRSAGVAACSRATCCRRQAKYADASHEAMMERQWPLI